MPGKEQNSIVVFTDGSSRGNPGPGGWGAIIASKNYVYELSGANAETTNNRMELEAVLASLRFLFEAKQHDNLIIIHSDSQYFKKGFESWMYGWQARGWVTAARQPVANQDQWQELLELQSIFTDIKVVYVRGHVGTPGNEQADKLATEAADKGLGIKKRYLKKTYSVSLSVPSINNLDGSKLNKSEGANKKKRKTGKAYGYLSLINGVVADHKTWDECQSAVKGKSKVKYRRVDSKAERDQVVADWQRNNQDEQ